MKKMIVSIALTLSSLSFAQVQTNPMEICEAIRRVTSYPERVTNCVVLASRNTYDPSIVPVIRNLVNKHTLEAVHSLEAAANARYTPEAAESCQTILNITSYPERVTSCIKTSANQMYQPEVPRLATRLASKHTLEAVNLLAAAANGYFQPSAVEVCDAILSVTNYPERVVACINTIKNKVFLNGAENFCRNLAQNNTLEAINCMNKVAVDYVPVPTDFDIIIRASQLQDLKRTHLKAKAQLERGMTAQAIRSLEEAANIIRDIEQQNQIR